MSGECVFRKVQSSGEVKRTHNVFILGKECVSLFGKPLKSLSNKYL